MLEDVLDHNLRLVICGTAVGNKSAAVKQYYVGKGNKFWKILAQVGLTQVELKPSEYKKLLDFGIGLTDLVKTKSGLDKHLECNDFETKKFEKKITKFSPDVVCFNGKKAAKEYLKSKKISCGLQNKAIGKSKIFVVPSTSAAANAHWNIKFWKELVNLCKQNC